MIKIKPITFLYLFIGAVMQGASMAFFLFPNNIPSGGAAGLAILINHLISMPLGSALWIVNFVFLFIALFYFGKLWTLKTMFAVSITSLTISFIESFLKVPTLPLWLDLIYGSIIFGIGVGILIRNGSSSGGMVIPALMIASIRNTSPGNAMFMINVIIFLMIAFIKDITIIVYAILCQLATTKIIDFIYNLQLVKHKQAILFLRKLWVK